MKRASSCSIQQDYCPLCYRGASTAVRVRLDSPRIDEDQAACCRAFGGLPLLDLRAEGERCPSPCKLACAVCGNVLAFSCEPAFEQALAALEEYEEESLETRVEVLQGMQCLAHLGQRMAADLERRFARRLRGLGMAWLPRWKRLAHPHCTKKAACDCLVPLVAETCRTHGKRVPPSRVKAAIIHEPAAQAMQASNNKIHHHSDASVAEGAARPTAMLKAPWLLGRHSAGVRVPPQEPPAPKPKPPPRKPDARLESAAAGCARLDTQAGLTKPPPGTVRAAGKQPASRKRDHRLEAASKLSQRLDSWAGSGPARPQAPTAVKLRPQQQEAAQCTLPTRHPCFCRKRHLAEFDPYLHGYMRKNGVDMYRFYDGFEVRVHSGVNELTDDGRMLPL
jgi:hypothetical protein